MKKIISIIFCLAFAASCFGAGLSVSTSNGVASGLKLKGHTTNEGDISGGSFVGNGSGLTNLNAVQYSYTYSTNSVTNINSAIIYANGAGDTNCNRNPYTQRGNDQVWTNLWGGMIYDNSGSSAYVFSNSVYGDSLYLQSEDYGTPVGNNYAPDQGIGNPPIVTAATNIITTITTNSFVSATTFTGALNGNATSASVASNLWGSVNGLPFLSIKSFGAYGDCVQLTNASILATSNILTALGGGFTSNDIGKNIEIIGAGNVGTNLATWITNITSSTVCTVSNVAIRTATSVQAYYGHNDTPYFQAAINYADSIGGALINVPDGMYLLDSPYTSYGAATYSMLTLPVYLNAGTQPAVTIALVGVTPPNFNARAKQSGAVIVCARTPTGGSSLTSSIDKCTVLGSVAAQSGGDFYGYTFIQLDLANLVFRTFSNPTVNPLRLNYIGQIGLRNILVDTGVDVDDEVQPTWNSIGLNLPLNNSVPWQSAEHVTVIGYNTDFVISECLQAEDLQAWGGNYGFVLKGNSHSSYISSCFIYGCVTNIYKTTDAIGTFFFNNVNGEWNTGKPNAWQDSQALFVDTAGMYRGGLVLGALIPVIPYVPGWIVSNCPAPYFSTLDSSGYGHYAVNALSVGSLNAQTIAGNGSGLTNVPPSGLSGVRFTGNLSVLTTLPSTFTVLHITNGFIVSTTP